MRPLCPTLLALALLVPAVAVAAEPGTTAIDSARFGNLRSVTALGATLDLYRSALAEIELASRLLVDRAEYDAPSPHTPLPQNVSEVFTRIDRVVTNRVPHEALGALSKGIHAVAVDALDGLEAAKTFGDVQAPLGEMVAAIEMLVDASTRINAVFSGDRPISVQVFDESSALAQIADGIDGVAVAERRIAELRKKGAGLGEQFGAFLELEIALGNALDLIAAAQTAGIHIGFDFNTSLAEFRPFLDEVIQRHRALATLHQRMLKVPRADPMRIVALGRGEGSRIEIKAQWHNGGVEDPAAWRLTLEPGRGTLAKEVEASALCRGTPPTVARELATAAATTVKTVELGLVGASGREFGAAQVEGASWFADAPWSVKIAPVNSFGVSAPAGIAPLERVGKMGEPPWIRAWIEPVEPTEPEFYREHDRVRIEWGRAAGDLSAAARRNAQARGYPIVRGYEVVRHAGSSATTVSRVPTGITSISDWPGAGLLSLGVNYSVRAIGADGEPGAWSESCEGLALVRANLAPALALAAAGAKRVPRPSRVERALTEEALAGSDPVPTLRDVPAELSIGAWWRGLDSERRRTSLERWPSLFGAQEKKGAERVEFPLPERDRLRIIAEIWLGEQDPLMQGEVERYWALLHPTRRAELEARWIERRNPRRAASLRQRLASADAELRRDMLHAARVQGWLEHKGETERALLEFWWTDELSDDERKEKRKAYFSKLDQQAFEDIRWPVLSRMSEAESTAAMSGDIALWPRTLRAEYLSWYRFETLAFDAKLRTTKAEAGPGRFVDAGIYALRPVDRLLGFKLVELLALVIFLAFVLLRVRKQAHAPD